MKRRYSYVVPTGEVTREPHCLDCECEGCEIVRERSVTA